jgi:hypothetical protein
MVPLPATVFTPERAIAMSGAMSGRLAGLNAKIIPRERNLSMT